MSIIHACFADMPMETLSREGHSQLDVVNDDAIRQCRSISPNCSNSPIPRYERNMGFFCQLSRRFGLRSNDDLVFTSSNEDDNQSSSTDSSSLHTVSAAGAVNIASLAGNNNKKASEYISCASSETSSTLDIEEQLLELRLHQQEQCVSRINTDDNGGDNRDEDNDPATANSNHNANDAYNKERKSFARSSRSHLQRRSTSSLRRAFEAFSHSTRSLSCGGATPPPTLPASPSSSSTNNVARIKSALKSSSNLELNKKSQTSQTCCLRKFSYCLVPSAGKSTTSSSSPSSSFSSSTTSSKIKAKPTPQRILRQPVSYTYLKGISGLPTQRVPRNSVCCQYARR